MVRMPPSRAVPARPGAPHRSAIVMRTGEPELVAKVTDDVLFAAARGHGHLDELRKLGMRRADASR